MEEKENINVANSGEEKPLTRLQQYEKEQAELKAEKKEYREQRKNKRGRKALRGRKTKNLIWFLVGFLCSLIILGLGIFVGAKLLPMNTYLKNDKIVKSDTIGERSIVDAVMNIGDYGMSDIPIAYDKVNELLNNGGLGGVITVDSEGLKLIKFDNTFGDSLMKITKISKDAFGDLSKLELFVTTAALAGEELKPDANKKMFYFYNNGKLEKAFNDDGILKTEAQGCTLFYPALNEISIKEMKEIIGDRFKTLKIKSVLEAFGGVKEDSDIAKIIGDKTVAEMGSFKADEILLKDVLKAEDTNKLWKILKDATGKEVGAITLGDLKNFNANDVKLSTVIDSDGGNSVLKALLKDDTVTLGNIATKINNIKLTEMFEVTCFTTDASKTNDTSVKYEYDEATNSYEYSPTGTYYISKESKVWMYLFYTVGSATQDVGGKKIITEYTDNGLTFSNMESSVGSVAGKVMQSTVYQLYLVGILDSNYDKIQNETLTSVMITLNSLL